MLGIVLDASQQDHVSVDCGIDVLYIIRQYFRRHQVVKKDFEMEIQSMRTEIV